MRVVFFDDIPVEPATENTAFSLLSATRSEIDLIPSQTSLEKDDLDHLIGNPHVWTIAARKKRFRRIRQEQLGTTAPEQKFVTLPTFSLHY
jgi:hypothetical protein